MSGETLRAPRQQLRLLRASAFDLALDFQGLLKSAMVARLSGARRVYGFARNSLREPASRILLHERVQIPDHLHVIRKNLALLTLLAALVGGMSSLLFRWRVSHSTNSVTLEELLRVLISG